MTQDLNTLLNSYSSQAINAIASFHGVLPKGSKQKNIVVAELFKILPDRERVLKQWDDLSKAERALMESVLRRNGTATVRTLREELRRKKLIENDTKPDVYGRHQPANPRDKESRRFEDVLARLTLRGLLFAAEDPPLPYQSFNADNAPKRDFTQYSNTVFIPDEIRQHLPELPPLEVAPAKPITVASTQESSARSFQRDLYLYWSFVRDHPFSLTLKDEPHKTTLRDVNNILLNRATLNKGEGEVDHPRLRFLRLTLAALGALKITARIDVQANDADFFALAPAERVNRCYETWRETLLFNELLILPPDVRPYKVEPLLIGHKIIATARQTILQRLTALTGSWITFDHLINDLYDNDYEFLFHRPAPSQSYYTGMSPYYSQNNPLNAGFIVTDEREGWKKIEANFIRSVISGPLFWMGLIDLGWKGGVNKEAEAFKVTPLGAWLLAAAPQPEIRAEGGRVIAQPNLHITALDPVNDATLVTLDSFAERLSAERAVEYQLTRASVYRGQQSGWDVERIKKFLVEQTGADLPGNVARTLDEWQTQHQRIVIHRSLSLAHGDANLLDAAQKESAAFVRSRPLPEVALLTDAQAIVEIEKKLRAKNILPIVTRQPAISANSVEANDVGEIHFLTRRPNFYLHGHLAAFADYVSDEQYRITSASAQRAARAGLATAEIIKRLELVHRGPVPQKLINRIRAWAKHYGDAALEEVSLLQVRDEATLKELLNDPEIAVVLKPFAPAINKALARVRREDVEKLRVLLAERGIDLDDKIK